MADAHPMWVMGEERPGNGEFIPIEDPATGEVFARCHSASDHDVSEIVKQAHDVFKSGTWSKASRHARADVLDAAAALLAEEIPSLIPLEVRQTGRAIRELSAQVPTLTKWFRYYAALLRTEERPVLPTTGKLHNWVDRVPLGVVVQITPFNHPLLIAVKKLAPALAAGNSVIVKPSELTPLTTLRLGPVLKKAGLPDGVLTVLPGYGATTGRALAQQPLVRKVDVTGGTIAGRAIGAVAGENLARYTAELGGKAPLVVLEKANLDAAVNGIAFGSFVASGQTCVASTRIVVDNKVLPTLLDKLKAKTESIARRIGAPSNPASTMGPLVSEAQLRRVERIVESSTLTAAVEVVAGGRRMSGPSALDGTDLSRGYFYEPTVIAPAPGRDGVKDTPIWSTEAFGPVIVVVGFDTEEEAVGLANDSEFGLGAAVWTQDLAQAHRVSERIDAGIVWVNTHHRNDPSSPWGGSKGSSGVGSENGVDAYHAYTTMKSTIINYASPEESLAAEDWFGESAAGSVRYG